MSDAPVTRAIVTSNITEFFQLLKEVEDLAIALALKIEDINNFKLEIGTEKMAT